MNLTRFLDGQYAPGWLLCCLAILLTALPRVVSTGRFIQINEPLSVKLSQQEPPRIAFDALTSSKPMTISELPRIQYNLNTGAVSYPRAVQLSEVQISRNDFEDVQAEENIRVGKIYRGKIELAGGLSFGPDTHLEVRRMERGIIKDWGRVDPQNGTFELISQVQRGEIKVVLVDTSGNILGEATKPANEKPNQKQEFILYPSVNSFIMHAKSWADIVSQGPRPKKNPPSPSQNPSAKPEKKSDTQYLTSAQPMETTDTAKDTAVEFDGFRINSQTLLKAHREGHATTMMMVDSGASVEIPLFSEQTIEALREIIRSQLNISLYPETGALLWGRVMKSGKPQGNVKVSVETQEQYPVVYLNELFIPDLSLKTTAEHGYFVVLDLPEGMHAIKAVSDAVTVGHANVVMSNDAISYLKVEMTQEQTDTEVTAFDLFKDANIEGVLQHQFVEDDIEIKSRQNVRLQKSPTNALVYFTPSVPDYMKMLYVQSPESQDAGELNLPVFSNRMVQNWIFEAKANIQPDKGSMIVWMNTQTKTFSLPTAQLNPEQIIYFDQEGARTENTNRAVGALIINLDSGVQTVVTEYFDATLKSYVVPVDVGITTVLPFSF